MKQLSIGQIDSYREHLHADPAAKASMAAAARTEIKDLVFLPAAAAKLNGDFTIEVKTRGITAQQKSGRCWAFAAMNIMREKVAEKCGLEEFELSQNYLTFFDKLEKAHNFLEMVIENLDKDMEDRMMEYILYGIGDGGYWDMAADLAVKYGVVPKSAMPETYQSEHTEKFLYLINTLLKKDAALLRRAYAEGKDVRQMEETMMAEIFKMQCIFFGEPVQVFDFEYRDKNGEYHVDRGLTPKAFYDKYVGIDLKEYVTITAEPTTNKKADMRYCFHYMGSMADKDVQCLNLTFEEMEQLCIAQLKDGEPVWFGNDSRSFGDRTNGVWDQDSFDYSGVMGGADLFIPKGDRLEYGASFATHAMILTGVSLDEEGKPLKWKIENSWGGEVGKKGYFVCSEAYFKEYVYEAIILKKHLNEKQLALWNSEPVRLQPWQK